MDGDFIVRATCWSGGEVGKDDSSKMSNKAETVKVVVRIRPLSGEEIRNGNQKASVAEQDRGMIVVKNPKADDREPPKNFTFDHVFDENVTQKFIYDSCMCHVVEACLEGFNGTVFACKFLLSILSVHIAVFLFFFDDIYR